MEAAACRYSQLFLSPDVSHLTHGFDTCWWLAESWRTQMSEAAVFRTALRGNQVCELSPGSGSGLLHCMASSIPVITKGVITGWSSPLSVALEELTSLSPAFWKLTCEIVHDEILRTSLA